MHIFVFIEIRLVRCEPHAAAGNFREATVSQAETPLYADTLAYPGVPSQSDGIPAGGPLAGREGLETTVKKGISEKDVWSSSGK